VNLVGYCEEKNRRILVYEYMSNGSLEQKLTGKLGTTFGNFFYHYSIISFSVMHGLTYHQISVPYNI